MSANRGWARLREPTSLELGSVKTQSPERNQLDGFSWGQNLTRSLSTKGKFLVATFVAIRVVHVASPARSFQQLQVERSLVKVQAAKASDPRAAAMLCFAQKPPRWNG